MYVCILSILKFQSLDFDIHWRNQHVNPPDRDHDGYSISGVSKCQSEPAGGKNSNSGIHPSEDLSKGPRSDDHYCLKSNSFCQQFPREIERERAKRAFTSM